MKHIHLDDKDTTSVDMALPVPEQTLRDLICITEDSIIALAGQMDSMSTNLPDIVDKLQELIECMDRNTDRGIAKTDELLEAMKEE